MRKIVGIGNALTDVLVQIPSDEIITEVGLAKGAMTLIDDSTRVKIQSKVKEFGAALETGGSAGNTINTLARLGQPCGFIGKIADDSYGSFFTQRMQQMDVQTYLLQSKDLPSGCATTLISTNGERTFGTFLGAASALDAEDLTADMFQGYSLLHIEGYLVINFPLITRAMQLAKEAGLLISLDLASYNVVEACRDDLHQLITTYVDIVFANEEEAYAYTQKEPRQAAIQIAEECLIGVVKIGSEGSLIASKGEICLVDGIPAVCKDSTGAGDIYAAGFLYGYINGYSLKISGQIGNLIAAAIVEELGTRLSEEKWSVLLPEIKRLCNP